MDYSRPLVDLKLSLRDLHNALLAKDHHEARKLTDVILADIYAIRAYLEQQARRPGIVDAVMHGHFPPFD